MEPKTSGRPRLIKTLLALLLGLGGVLPSWGANPRRLPPSRVVNPIPGVGSAGRPGLPTPQVAPPSLNPSGIPALVPARIPQAAPPAAPVPSTLGEALGTRAAEVSKGLESDPSGVASGVRLDQLYSSGNGKRPSGVSGPAGDPVFVLNDEGIRINGRARVYYQEVRRLVDKYRGKINFSESLNVMDDSYAEVWAKLKVIEGVAKSRNVDDHNMHLEETLTWVDGVMQDGKKKVAIHTHRVFFHKSPNPASEISEGIRRVNSYVKEAESHFARGGKTEQVLGPLDEVVLAFDTRGYDRIKKFLQSQERRLARLYPNRFRFVFVDQFGRVPKSVGEMRQERERLSAKYRGDGLQKIVEGVTYSRYVGLLLELKTAEHYFNLGYKILQSGRELFDAQKNYITELDAVVRSPQGVVYLVEAKSARVLLPKEDVLADKILYKLETYKKYQALIERSLGAPLNVVFSLDVGDLDKAPQGRRQREQIQRQRALVEFLKSQEKPLSDKYGFPVSFIFVKSGPEENNPSNGSRSPR